MGRAESCFDNAAAESWFSTLEWELFHTRRFDTKQNAGRNGPSRGGGMKPVSRIASQARSETEWLQTPGR